MSAVRSAAAGRARLLARALGLAALLLAAGVSARAQVPGVEREDDRVAFNFENVDLATAFESISEVLGLNYVVSGDVGGTITMRTREPIPIERVPELLDTLLRSQGLTLVRAGDLYIVSRAEGRVGTTADLTAGPRDIFVVHLKNADAIEIANLLVALFGGETGRFDRRERLEDRSLSRQLARMRLDPGETMIVPERGIAARAEGAAPAPVSVVGGELVGETTIVPDERTNSLVIRTVAENFASIRETIERLDIRPLQVMIEVVIAEVTLDEETQFGINFTRFFVEDGTEVEISNVNPAPLPPDSVGLTVSVFDPGRVRAVLRALASDGKLNVLSTPRILASNNQEARILIGSEVPFVQISSFGGIGNTVLQTIQFRDVGLELIVIPRINQDREVTLEVLQQNSSLSSTSFGNIDAPLITSRQAETSLVVGDRQTVVLGGLIETEREVRESGVPFLKDIPLLGYLFKSVRRSDRKTELVITLTPYIIGSDAEAELLRDRTEREWDAFRDDPDELERGPFPDREDVRPAPDLKLEVELEPRREEEP